MTLAHEAADTKSLEKPQRRPFQRRPSPLARCIETAGDVNAGNLLYQVQYRFKYKDTLFEHEGALWIAQTAKCWWTETGLTAKQYKRALRILKETGLIEVKHAKVRARHSWPRTFIRLVDELDGDLQLDPIGSSASGPPGVHMTGGPSGDHLKGKEHPRKEKHGEIFALPAPKTSPTQHNNKEEKGTIRVLRKDIEDAWLAAHTVIYPNLAVTPFAGSDWNNARILIEKLGDDAPAIVDAAVANWDSFLSALEGATGLFNQGDRPCLNKLGKHADVALQWWRQKSPANSVERGREDVSHGWDGMVEFGEPTECQRVLHSAEHARRDAADKAKGRFEKGVQAFIQALLNGDEFGPIVAKFGINTGYEINYKTEVRNQLRTNHRNHPDLGRMLRRLFHWAPPDVDMPLEASTTFWKDLFSPPVSSATASSSSDHGG